MSFVVSARVQDELAVWLDAYAARRGVRRQAVVEAALEAFRRDCQAGVPDLPAPGRVGRPRRLDSPSDVERWALERQARLNEAKGEAG